MYTALFFTIRLSASRIFTRKASNSTIGYIRSTALLCHSRTSSSTASVTRLIRSGCQSALNGAPLELQLAHCGHDVSTIHQLAPRSRS